MKYKFIAIVVILMVTIIIPFPTSAFSVKDSPRESAINIKNAFRNIFPAFSTTSTKVFEALKLREEKKKVELEIKTRLADDSNMKTGDPFCSKISFLKSELEIKAVERGTETLKKQLETRERVEKQKEVVREKISENRDDWSEGFREHFKKLESRATTESEKVAVRTFRTSVESALNTRRIAVDEATRIFKEISDGNAKARNAKFTEITEAYRASINSASEKAKKACSENAGNVKQIRATYNAEIKSAKDKFNSDRKAVEIMKTDLSEEAREYKKALDTANKQFKEAVDNALKELKKVFPKA